MRSKPGTGSRPGADFRPSGSPVERVAAGQHRGQLVGLDLAVEAEVRGGAADPVALGLALAGVVVLGAFGDLLGVVALLADAELPDREHQRERPSGGVGSVAVFFHAPIGQRDAGLYRGDFEVGHTSVVRREAAVYRVGWEAGHRLLTSDRRA